jgi:hypothetical protein
MLTHMSKVNIIRSLVVAVPLLAVTLTGCTSTVNDPAPTATASQSATKSASPTPSTSASATKSASDGKSVQAILDTLTVAPAVSKNAAGQTYVREYFKHWVSENDTGCDTRVAVLLRDSKTKPVLDGCKVVSGDWVSAYDDKEYKKPGGMDIDHMVPLSEAWQSGALDWDAATRQSYANDLGYDFGLVPVSAHSNRSKSDQDPTTWKPDTDACVYVGHWTMVKYRWNLTIDQAEKDAIGQVLAFCADNYSVPVPEKAAVHKVSDTPTQEAPTVESGPEQTPSTSPIPAESAPSTEQAPAAPVPAGDPQFGTCGEANANGFGPYVKGTDPEYAWYQDRDGDGTVCEK